MWRKIGIDTTAITLNSLGVHNYVYELSKNLLSIDQSIQYVLYCQKAVPHQFKTYAKKAELKIAPIKNRKLCEQVWLSFVAPANNLDLLHCPAWGLPLYYPKKTVLTLHGLGWRFIPDMHDKKVSMYLRWRAERSARNATRLIAISQATKEAYVEHLGIPEDKIDVVHHGVNTDLFSQQVGMKRIERIRNRYALPPSFILYVGAMFKHKNIDTLIRAYSLLSGRKGFERIGLVIAGQKSLQYEYLRKLAINLGIDEKVRFTGYFPAVDLNALYKASNLFVFPSLYEGFGLPVLEAFASGVPLVASDIPALSEIAGDAAILVDPKNTDELAYAIEKVLLDESLQKDMIEKGLKRAKQFSWKKTAEKTLNTYKKVLKS
jgi:glycosyltransferase involved in cell wall biosynthesis